MLCMKCLVKTVHIIEFIKNRTRVLCTKCGHHVIVTGEK